MPWKTFPLVLSAIRSVRILSWLLLESLKGGVLSPLLFSLYVNDLLPEIDENVKLLQYADDLKLIAVASTNDTAISRLNEAAKRVSLWCDLWSLTINETKFKLICFTRQHLSLRSALILNKYLPFSNVIKDLGVLLDDNMTFTSHVEYVNKRLRSLVGIFYRNYRFLVGTTALRSIYFAYIQSVIDYGLPIWGFTASTKLESLEAAHRKFLKFGLGLHMYDHSVEYNELCNRFRVNRE